MKMQDVRDNIESLRESVVDGWQRIRQTATNALTRLRPGERSNLPARAEIDDAAWSPGLGWALMGGEVFEDEQRVIVRIEAPGMTREDLDVEVFDDRLEVRGEKRFEREDTEGRWRVLECAYGSFQRSIALPAPVLGDRARASYRHGVLKIELPKREPARPRQTRIEIH